MQLLDGQLVSEKWRSSLHEEITQLASQGIVPGLAILLVGDDPGSLVYTAMKERACGLMGIRCKRHHLPATATTDEVVALIGQLNADAATHGILVQLPLPPQIETQVALHAIDLDKDVDGLHPYNLGELLAGNTAMIPATPKGILRLLAHYQVPIEGKHVVIVGRSAILGKPLAAQFLNLNATVTVCHSKTVDLGAMTRLADIIVMGTGIPGLLTASMVKEGVVVIDAGITKLPDGRIVGDVNFDEVAPKARAITPVPGGIGPMTIAALLDSTFELTRRRNK